MLDIPLLFSLSQSVCPTMGLPSHSESLPFFAFNHNKIQMKKDDTKGKFDPREQSSSPQNVR